MGAPDVLAQLAAHGVNLSRQGNALIARPRSALTDELRALIRENKPALLDALAAAHAMAAGTSAISERDCAAGSEARRQRVLAMLADVQSVRYAVLTDAESDPEAVILALAIRGVGTCELRIPRAKYDPFLLLQLIDRHGGTVH